MARDKSALRNRQSAAWPWFPRAAGGDFLEMSPTRQLTPPTLRSIITALGVCSTRSCLRRRGPARVVG